MRSFIELKVSIIIPLYVIVPRFFRDLKKFRKLNYSNYEILIVTDREVDNIDEPKVRVIYTGKKRTGPAEKRDIAISQSKGDICAFIDDDAYPHPNWLKNAMIHFNHPLIAAVGGPGVTPKEDKYWEQLTGFVYESYFTGGKARYRFVRENMRFVDDYPAYNLLVRKKVLEDVGGYGSHYYGGEDTFLCLKIHKKGGKILYDPDVVVYHHRRALFLPYLKQIANIGRHRGYFARKYPETSRRLFYFLPSSLVIFGLILILMGLLFNFLYIYFFVFLFIFSYLVSIFSVVRKAGFLDSLIVSIGILATHVVYGSNFIKGFLTKNIKL